MRKSKFCLTLAAVFALAAILLHRHFTIEKLRQENAILAARLDLARAIPSSADPAPPNHSDNLEKMQQELNSLRNEAGLLKKQNARLADVTAENAKLKALLRSAGQFPQPQETPPEDAKTEMITLMTDAKKGALGAFLYSESNGGYLPADITAISQYMTTHDPVNLENFEMLPGYRPIKLAEFKESPSSTILFRAKTAKLMPNGKYGRAYAFLDGHSEIHMSDTADFSAWENEHSRY